jgi:hypothetical protein
VTISMNFKNSKNRKSLFSGCVSLIIFTGLLHGCSNESGSEGEKESGMLPASAINSVADTKPTVSNSTNQNPIVEAPSTAPGPPSSGKVRTGPLIGGN